MLALPPPKHACTYNCALGTWSKSAFWLGSKQCYFEGVKSTSRDQFSLLLGQVGGLQCFSDKNTAFGPKTVDFGGCLALPNQTSTDRGGSGNSFSERLILGEILGSIPQKKTFPKFFREADFGRNPPKHSGTFPNLFREADFGGHPRKQFPKTLAKNTWECSRIFFGEGDFGGNPQEQSPENVPEFFFGEADFGRKAKTLGNVPEFFFGEVWGNPRKQSPKSLSSRIFFERLILGGTLGSIPQIHSGTFPIFFREADFGGNPRKQSPKTLGNVPETFSGG